MNDASERVFVARCSLVLFIVGLLVPFAIARLGAFLDYPAWAPILAFACSLIAEIVGVIFGIIGRRYLSGKVGMIGSAVAVLAGGFVLCCVLSQLRFYVSNLTDYNAPPPQEEVQLVNDKLADKNPAFDEALVDSRPLGDWRINASAAVVRLDCPMVKPDVEPDMLTLCPSYRDAITAAKDRHAVLLPSANMLDGAAKQFDDALYAAIDLAGFRGELGLGPAAPAWAAAVFAELPSASQARPFLAAALELAGKPPQLSASEQAAKGRWLAEFEANKPASKPISFYDWTPELQQVWRFYRFLQHEFSEQELGVARDMAAVLKANAALREQHRALECLFARLTNPPACLSVEALVDAQAGLVELAGRHGARRPTVAVFPPSTSREAELFDRTFPKGVPAAANLMAVLINRIRSGQVNLQPSDKDGWYQHQVYALETLLLPADAQEKDKLLLTAAYKKRLIEAFKALVTKRRETHMEFLGEYTAKARPLGKNEVRPRLRVEPCATFYLRTARAYAFLETLLKATVGQQRLKGMYGLKQGGRRPLPLDAELDGIRRRFYGFYLLACEDIGMKPAFLDGEPVDQQAARQEALLWLDGMASDGDLACDTRAAVPISADARRGRTRLWATLGVRMAHLKADYARPPRVRPSAGKEPWKDAEPYQLGESRYVIAVNEFAEIEVAGSQVPTRAELREVCDRLRTKEEIVRTLSEQ